MTTTLLEIVSPLSVLLAILILIVGLVYALLLGYFDRWL